MPIFLALPTVFGSGTAILAILMTYREYFLFPFAFKAVFQSTLVDIECNGTGFDCAETLFTRKAPSHFVLYSITIISCNIKHISMENYVDNINLILHMLYLLVKSLEYSSSSRTTKKI